VTFLFVYKIGVRPDVIVVDPPRAGCDKAVLENFAHLKPKRIVYVSCNPATLARDIAILSEYGYVAKEIQPVDMFSETSHIECVALLEKK
jgi:23S rRNA (uracil1939-C5)-methyltransferase